MPKNLQPEMEILNKMLESQIQEGHDLAKSGTTPERDQEGIGAVSIQPPDEQQPNA